MSVARQILGVGDDTWPVQGMVFLANQESIDEMLDTLLFGMPSARFKLVQRIRVGTVIFLYDLHNMMFHGLFEAVSPGCLNLDRYAFGGNARGGSSRPAQVQVTYTEQFFPTHWWLFENVPGLFYAGTNKVDQLLNEEQIVSMRNVMMKEYERQTYNLGPPLPCPPLRPQQGPFLLPGIRPNSWERPYGEPLDTYIRKQLSDDYYTAYGYSEGPEFLDPIDDGTFTSVIIKNVPYGLTADMLVDSLGRCGFHGCFDFFLLKVPAQNYAGHAILNFTTRDAAIAIYYEIGRIQQYWPPYNGRIQRPVSWAKAQGVEGLQGRVNYVIPVIQGDPSTFHISESMAYIFELPERRVYEGSMYDGGQRAENQTQVQQRYVMPQDQIDDGELDEGEIPPEVAENGEIREEGNENSEFQTPSGLRIQFPSASNSPSQYHRGERREEGRSGDQFQYPTRSLEYRGSEREYESDDRAESQKRYRYRPGAPSGGEPMAPMHRDMMSHLSYVPSETDSQHHPYRSERYSRGYNSYEDPYSSESTISQRRQGRLPLRPHDRHHEDGLYPENGGLWPSLLENRDFPQNWERQRMGVVETARSKNRSPSANLSFHEESVSQGEIMEEREVKSLPNMPPLPEKKLMSKQVRKQKHEALQREIEEKKEAKRKRHEEIMKEGERTRALKKAKREAHEAAMKRHAEAKERKAPKFGVSPILKSMNSEFLQSKKGENKSESKPENKKAAVLESKNEANKSESHEKNGGRQHEKIVWVARPSQEREKAPELPRTRSEAKKRFTKRHDKGNKTENLPGPPPGIPPQSAMRSKPEENDILPPPPPKNPTQKMSPPSKTPIFQPSRQTSPQLVKIPSQKGPNIEERVKEEPETVLASQIELFSTENFDQAPNLPQKPREELVSKHTEDSEKQKLESEQIQRIQESNSIPPEICTESNLEKTEKENVVNPTSSQTTTSRELSMSKAQNPDLPKSDASNHHREDETMAEAKIEKGVPEQTENLPASHDQIAPVKSSNPKAEETEMSQSHEKRKGETRNLNWKSVQKDDKTQQRETEIQVNNKKSGTAETNNNEIEDDLFEFGADFVAI